MRRYTCSADSNRLYDYTCLADGSIFVFGLFPQIHIPRVKFQTRTYSKIVISKVNLSLVRSDAESTSVCLTCPFDILAFDIPSTGRGQVKPCNVLELFYVFRAVCNRAAADIRDIPGYVSRPAGSLHLRTPHIDSNAWLACTLLAYPDAL